MSDAHIPAVKQVLSIIPREFGMFDNGFGAQTLHIKVPDNCHIQFDQFFNPCTWKNFANQMTVGDHVRVIDVHGSWCHLFFVARRDPSLGYAFLRLLESYDWSNDPVEIHEGLLSIVPHMTGFALADIVTGQHRASGFASHADAMTWAGRNGASIWRPGKDACRPAAQGSAAKVVSGRPVGSGELPAGLRLLHDRAGWAVLATEVPATEELLVSGLPSRAEAVAWAREHGPAALEAVHAKLDAKPRKVA